MKKEIEALAIRAMENNELPFKFYHEIEDEFEADLNENLPVLEIGTLHYEAGFALRLIDEIAFRQELLAYVDGMEYVVIEMPNGANERYIDGETWDQWLEDNELSED